MFSSYRSVSSPPGMTPDYGTSCACQVTKDPARPASGWGSLMFMRESESDPAATALEGLRRLEARVDALAEAIEVLARGLEGSPMAEPGSSAARESARRAHELLLLAKPGDTTGSGRQPRSS
jgi:hypothetical protein